MADSTKIVNGLVMRRMPPLKASPSSNVSWPDQVGVGPDCVIMPKAFEDWYPKCASFSVRPDDVWVVTYPKSGTTWTQEMVWCLLHGRESPEANLQIYTRFPFFEYYPLNAGRAMPSHLSEDDPMHLEHSWKRMQEMNPPRTIKTHLPKDLLPPHLWQIKPKVVYVCRDPRDVCVSSFFFHRKIRGYLSLEDFVPLFLEGRVTFAPYWQHVLGFWEMRNEEHILYIRYEDMQKDLQGVIRQVAAFLEVKVDDAEVASLAYHCSFDQMRTNPATNHEYLVNVQKRSSENIKFMRKGKAGDWKNHLTQEQVKAFKQWTEQYLKGSDFPYYRDYE